MRIFTKAQEILANDENRNQETEFCLKKLKRRITKEAMRLDGEDGTGLEEHHEGMSGEVVSSVLVSSAELVNYFVGESPDCPCHIITSMFKCVCSLYHLS